MSIPKLVANTALVHYYDELPNNNGKPQIGKEWTVFAAIVAVETTPDKNNAWVVSSATGSKCVAVQSASSSFKPFTFPPCSEANGTCKVCCEKQTKGMVLHDSHAEILARRGLLSTLWKEIQAHLERKDVVPMGKSSKYLLHLPEEHRVARSEWKRQEIKFDLRPDIQLHLYISDSPCGDASIYAIEDTYQTSKLSDKKVGPSLNFTGAKLIVSQVNESIVSSNNESSFAGAFQMGNGERSKTVREKDQVLGALRLKSCRSNIPSHLRSMSMSCSDKLCKWAVLGIQGSGLLASILCQPLRLTSIVVSHDPRQVNGDVQLKALERAIVVRAERCLEVLAAEGPSNDLSQFLKSVTLPSVHVVHEIFHQGLSQSALCTSDSSISSTSSSRETASDPTTKKRKIDSTRSERDTKRKQKISPCGVAFNWHQINQSNCSNGINMTKNSVEQIVGAKGIVQGKRPMNLKNAINSTSRLSRRALWNRSKTCFELLVSQGAQTFIPKKELETMNVMSYQEAKRCFVPAQLAKIKNLLLEDLKTSPLAGWIRNSADDDFFIHDGTFSV